MTRRCKKCAKKLSPKNKNGTLCRDCKPRKYVEKSEEYKKKVKECGDWIDFSGQGL